MAINDPFIDLDYMVSRITVVLNIQVFKEFALKIRFPNRKSFVVALKITRNPKPVIFLSV